MKVLCFKSQAFKKCPEAHVECSIRQSPGWLEDKGKLNPAIYCPIGIFYSHWKGIFGPEFLTPDKFVDKRSIIKAGEFLNKSSVSTPSNPSNPL